MLKLLTSIVALSAACVTSVSAFPTWNDLAPRATASNFSLFAYGSATNTEIGGFPLFYYDGLAYICNPAKINYTSNYVVFENNSTQWVANPLTVSQVPWQQSLLYIPVGWGPIGFYTEGSSNISESDIITSGFQAYGSVAMVSIDGTFYTDWYAVATDVDGLWSVGWNATAEGNTNTDAELISLRKGKAANVVYPDFKFD